MALSSPKDCRQSQYVFYAIFWSEIRSMNICQSGSLCPKTVTITWLPGRGQDKILSWYILLDRYKISGRRPRNFGPLRAEFAWREWRKTLGGHVANWAGLSVFSPRENKISHIFFIDCINKYSRVSNAHNSDDCHGVLNGGMLNKGWSFSRSRFDCLGLMHFFHGLFWSAQNP